MMKDKLIRRSLKKFIMANYYIYVIRCSDNSLYTGYTNDVERRFRLHEQGKGAKYTRGRAPLILEYVESFPTKSEALKAEYAFKKLTKRQKERFLQERKQIQCGNKKVMNERM